MITLVASLAGGLGAVLRYGIGTSLQRRTDRPLTTAVVNISGALALGIVAASSPGDAWVTVLGTGLLGGFTTFSTWMVDAITVSQRHRALRGLLDIGVVAIAGWGAYWLVS